MENNVKMSERKLVVIAVSEILPCHITPGGLSKKALLHIVS